MVDHKISWNHKISWTYLAKVYQYPQLLFSFVYQSNIKLGMNVHTWYEHRKNRGCFFNQFKPTQLIWPDNWMNLHGHDVCCTAYRFKYLAFHFFIWTRNTEILSILKNLMDGDSSISKHVMLRSKQGVLRSKKRNVLIETLKIIRQK